MMRRIFILLSLLWLKSKAQQIQQEGTRNGPKCPVCKTDGSWPAMHPVVVDPADGTQTTLTGVKVILCEKCGSFYGVQAWR